MIAATIGILAGFLSILIIGLLKTLDNRTTYGLVLTGISFIYVGFTWSHLGSLVASSIQAIAFLLLANVGIRKHPGYLIAGFFLHGAWDLFYPLFSARHLIPPQYDIFCLSIDFTMGLYLFYVQLKRKGPGRKLIASVPRTSSQ